MYSRCGLRVINNLSKRLYNMLALASNNIINMFLEDDSISLIGILTKDTSFFIHKKLIK